MWANIDEKRREGRRNRRIVGEMMRGKSCWKKRKHF
jgi:hypothetical protein